MDFVDWRKPRDKTKANEPVEPQTYRRRGQKFHDYIEEIIYEAQQRGEFTNLAGEGKPLNLEDDSATGDKALSYRMLKSNGFAPAEIELAKEIRTLQEKAQAKLTKIIHQGRMLHARRVPPFASEKREYHRTVERAATEYEHTLSELNRKILTLNLTTPPTMHQPFLEVESLVQQFRQSCPLFDM